MSRKSEDSPGSSENMSQSRWFFESTEVPNRLLEEDPLKRRSPPRIWLKPGYEKEIIFVDDRGFSFFEHQISCAGKWSNWLTCLKTVGKCPICKSGNVSKAVTLFTVIDATGWIADDGTRYQNKLRLFVASPDVAAVLVKEKHRQENGLVGGRYLASKSSFSELCTTRNFRKICTENMADFNDPLPFDYEEIFRPLPVEAMMTVASKIILKGGDGE